MRYQDWDVLLFPGSSHVPIQEFRTACFLVQEGVVQTPTLVSYVPSLQRGAPFTISLHSWNQPHFAPPPFPHPAKTVDNGVWCVKVIVDGVCVSTSMLPSKTVWPQVISSSDFVDFRGERKSLSFPGFNRTILSRRDWDISDDLGRIKIFITQGFQSGKGFKAQFQPLCNIVQFSFHPAPIEYLEKCNIAWPNAVMWANPWTPRRPLISTAESGSVPMTTTCDKQAEAAQQHGRRDSGVAPSVVGGRRSLGPGSFNPNATLLHPYVDMNSLSSRCTSGVSATSSQPSGVWQPLTRDVSSDDKHDEAKVKGTSVEWRLPEDQLRQIIEALSGSQQHAGSEGNVVVTGSSVDDAEPGQSGCRTSGLSSMIGCSNRHRTPTDVTMHMSCTAFPDCTSDDPANGEVIHKTPEEQRAESLWEGTSSPSPDDKDAMEALVVKSKKSQRKKFRSGQVGANKKLRRKRNRSARDDDSDMEDGSGEGSNHSKRKVSKTQQIRDEEETDGVDID